MGALRFADSVIAQRPKVYYKMQDASGFPADASGNGLNADSTNGTPTYQQPGPMGDFSIGYPTSAFQQRAAAPVTVVTDNLTMSCWYRPTSIPGNDITIFFNGNTGASGYGLVIDTNLTFQLLRGGSGFGTSSLKALPLNVWSLLHLVRRATSWEYWINGVFDSVGSTTSPNLPTAVFIWAWSSGVVNMAHLAVYETPLTGAVILDQYVQASLPDVIPQRIPRLGRGAGW